jgi:carboxyl-terminal processing protease
MGGDMNKIYVYILILFIVGCNVFAEPRTDRDQIHKELERFTEVFSIIQQYYVDTVPARKIIDGALKGMLRNLDPNSEFLEPRDFEELRIRGEGEYGGLGIFIGIRDEMLTVIAPMPDTPAARAGIRSGDRIVRIDNESTEGIQISDAVDRLRGKPGTKVKIVIWEERDRRLRELELIREEIQIRPIQAEKIIEEDIGYIGLTQFNEHTIEALDRSLGNLKEQGMRRLILDLRNNPGGLLPVALGVSERFLEDDDVIVRLSRRAEPGKTVPIKSSGKYSKNRTASDLPMIVLVNGGSASASEIVAGAIMDNKRGLILGTKTFGKGSVQTVIPLRDNYAVRLTTSRYYTPLGKPIDRGGILPDVIVEERPTVGVRRERTPREIFERLENDRIEEDDLPENIPEQDEDRVYDHQLEQAVFLLRGFKIYDSIRGM